MSLLFDNTLAKSLCDQSRSAPRRRSHYSLHKSDAETVHRLFVAMQPDSYVPPHRHLDPHKNETLIVLSGMLGFLEFSETGEVVMQARLGPQSEAWSIDIPAGQWHSIIALMPDTLFFETKAGPYLALTENERATWAPTEESAQAQAALSRLRNLFNV